MDKVAAKNKTVLVGVLRYKNDLRILLREHWYRIPVLYLPKRKFNYIAFYQPAIFRGRGKRIEYYARIVRRKIVKRIDLLSQESNHLRADNDYLKCEFSEIIKLPKPIKNIIPRRVSFGFTGLTTLRSARDILELYGVPPIEQIVAGRLKQIGISTVHELPVSIRGKRFRVDLAIFCRNGKIAIECDNAKAHASKFQKNKDKIKNLYLSRGGWRVIRLKEGDIIEQLNHCTGRIQKVIKTLG